ncbi:hypothetical protein GQ53DRAFT_115615 [Thozetella sp. PMI_491]|nr:hypothetical protein GQ53DRAFT_115615 [Thozetella sp. PMI_491]
MTVLLTYLGQSEYEGVPGRVQSRWWAWECPRRCCWIRPSTPNPSLSSVSPPSVSPVCNPRRLSHKLAPPRATDLTCAEAACPTEARLPKKKILPPAVEIARLASRDRKPWIPLFGGSPEQLQVWTGLPSLAGPDTCAFLLFFRANATIGGLKNRRIGIYLSSACFFSLSPQPTANCQQLFFFPLST